MYIQNYKTKVNHVFKLELLKVEKGHIFWIFSPAKYGECHLQQALIFNEMKAWLFYIRLTYFF